MKNSKNNPFQVVRNAVNTIFANKAILFPFSIILFTQFLILEICFFIPQYPLVEFFGPIIRAFYSEQYLHYPANLLLLPQLCQIAQIPVFIFLSSYCIGFAVSIIAAINEGKPVEVKKLARDTFGQYIHLVLATLLTYLLVTGGFKIFQLVYERALEIRSTSGKFFLLKMSVIQGAPYINLLISVFFSALMAYLIPIIILEKKKIIAALIGNFKTFFKAPFFTFSIIFIPSIFYVPVLLLRHNLSTIATFPELSVILIILSLFILFIIDSIVYTSLTTYYLVKKEDK
ncbi:MAG: hypothetical protein KC713_06785 [Candidatus Omnitrophica bacterium]|nr:hypothetical protein [Candidatus Omnitrophota bacterium]